VSHRQTERRSRSLTSSLAGSILAAPITTYIGRQKCLLLNCIFFLLGAAIMTASTTLPMCKSHSFPPSAELIISHGWSIHRRSWSRSHVNGLPYLRLRALPQAYPRTNHRSLPSHCRYRCSRYDHLSICSATTDKQLHTGSPMVSDSLTQTAEIYSGESPSLSNLSQSESWPALFLS